MGWGWYRAPKNLEGPNVGVMWWWGGREGGGQVRAQSCQAAIGCVNFYDLCLVGSRNPLEGIKWVYHDQM